MLKIALAQINTIVGDFSGNEKKILEYFGRAHDVGADVVVFPELSLTGYPPEDLLYKENFVKSNLAVLKRMARKVQGAVMIVGFVDCDKAKKLYNAAAVIAQGEVRGVYHKTDLPNYGVFDEKRYFLSGSLKNLFSLKGQTFAVNICEDIWTDQGVYFQQARHGAGLIINISSSPFDCEKLRLRQNLLLKRAKECRAYICYTNLVGGQDELVFDGGSFVVSPQGKVIARAPQFKEDLLTVELPINRNTKISLPVKHLPGDLSLSAQPWPKAKLASVDSQDKQILQALIIGTRDYVIKNGFKKVVIGLSGGIDSSLVAVIASQAVGKENVIGVSMPSQFTSAETRADAQLLAKNLKIRFKEIPIQQVYQSYLETLAEDFKGSAQGIAEENIQARIRGNLLMAFSNKFGWLVLTTGNKSEVAVGYCTLYGDMSGGFAVIKDVAKTKVYDISYLANKLFGPMIPQSVLDRAPSAELRENQRDQDSLPPYEILDSILNDYVEKHRSGVSIARKIKDLKTVQNVMSLVDHSEYKRRQAPPGIKITPRAFGKDWRLPMTQQFPGL